MEQTDEQIQAELDARTDRINAIVSELTNAMEMALDDADSTEIMGIGDDDHQSIITAIYDNEVDQALFAAVTKALYYSDTEGAGE